jgi:hypothetical protein
VLPDLRPEGILVELRGATACSAEPPPIPGSSGALHRLPGAFVADLGGGFVEARAGGPRARETYLYLESEIEALLRDGERASFAASAALA